MRGKEKCQLTVKVKARVKKRLQTLAIVIITLNIQTHMWLLARITTMPNKLMTHHSTSLVEVTEVTQGEHTALEEGPEIVIPGEGRGGCIREERGFKKGVPVNIKGDLSICFVI